MIDWRQGGWTGSLNKWARREVRSLIRNNETARRSRYPLSHALLRRFFSTRKLSYFVGAYLAAASILLSVEVVLALFPSGSPPKWAAVWGPPFDMLNASGYLIGAQASALGVISLALALITVIAQRESSATDIKVYYHESFAFEIIASCIALLAVLCVQLLWPLHLVLDQVGLRAASHDSRFWLLCIHVLWLAMNLFGLAHFIFTTFEFVQQPKRERLRELYTANVVLPRDLARRLRQQLYRRGSIDLLPGRADSDITFGIERGGTKIIEVQSTFRRPVRLHDVRMIWVQRVLLRWLTRSQKTAKKKPQIGRAFRRQVPMIWFACPMDEPLRRSVNWCYRRGGVELTKTEKFVLRQAFRFRTVADDPDLPVPVEILEELADKTAAQIDRLAPVAFDRAFREMVRYHGFLLALNALRTRDGSAASYAEVEGHSWSAPHERWIKQYRRLFERAVDQIPGDHYFIRLLGLAPRHLLQHSRDAELPPNILTGILDLGPIMMHGLEAWFTKRTLAETNNGEAAKPRLALAGSDAKAYADVLPDVVGTWESLLQNVSSIYRWSEPEHNEAECWCAFQASWPFLWRHLSNTAYCLALAVWNEDQAGSALFREALVRWPAALGRRIEDRPRLPRRRLLFPDLLKSNWTEASAGAASLASGYMHSWTPDQLFASIVHSAHGDAVLLTAAVLLSWTINDKQSSGIGAHTARALLRRESSSDTGGGATGGQDFTLQPLFLHLLRLEMAGDRFCQGVYGEDLDEFVRDLDNMTERRVVPGRVFTPSTMHERNDLQLAMVVILAAAAESGDNGGVAERIVDLAQDEQILPEGDGSLGGVSRVLDAFQSTLENPPLQLIRGFELLGGDGHADGISRVREAVIAAKAAIEAKRLERLKARPVDPSKVERIRTAVEKALLKGPLKVPFFQGVEIECGASNDAVEPVALVFREIEKAQLVDPPMVPPISNLEETFVTGSRDSSGHRAWHAFTCRPRTHVRVAARPEKEEFWLAIAPLVEQVGSDPLLVVSRPAEGRALRRCLWGPSESRPYLQDARDDSYLDTTRGVDVFEGELPVGVAWLFSARALRCVRYGELDENGRCVDVTFEIGEELKGRLSVRFRQQLDWADTPIFELRMSDPDQANAAER